MNTNKTGEAPRNVLLTGGSRGLGAAIASAFWAAGDNLLLVGRSRPALERVLAGLPPAAGQEASAVVADLGEPGAAGRVYEAARARWRALDVLVNAAATLGPVGPAWECDFEDWQRALRVDLLAPVELCRLAVPWMGRGGGGHILNISGGGATDPRPRFSAYATAKAGLVRFTETLAREVDGLGIQVNAVAPGRLRTDMTRQIVDAGAQLAGEKEWDSARAQQASADDGLARPAALCVFLTGPQAAGITGRLISAVWDDWPRLPELRDELATSDIFTLRRILPADRGRTW